MLDDRGRSARWAAEPVAVVQRWQRGEVALARYGSVVGVWADLAGRPRCEPLGALLRVAKTGDELAVEMVDDLVWSMLGPVRRRFHWVSDAELRSEMWSVLWRWPADRVVLIPTLRWEIARKLPTTNQREIPVGSIKAVTAEYLKDAGDEEARLLISSARNRHEEIGDVLKECAELLSPADVQVLRWSRVEGRSFEDIAVARGINVLSARVAVRRAESRLVSVARRVVVAA
jgi:hypothetical protein